VVKQNEYIRAHKKPEYCHLRRVLGNIREKGNLSINDVGALVVDAGVSGSHFSL
jgi:hypothetical protein